MTPSPRPAGGAITDVPGIAVGHAHDLDALTGCTAVLCPAGATVGVDVRGAAPGTRETDLCRPGTAVERAHGVLLTGGSAFGLEAAGGVVRHLHERGAGYPTRVVPVPIVPTAVIFDLGLGAVAWPDAGMGHRAAASARGGELAQGGVGAGAGASVGKLHGMEGATKSGVGTASLRAGELVVGALMVVNAVGDVVDPASGAILAGTREPGAEGYADSARLLREGLRPPERPIENTTIGVVATSAALGVEQANRLATTAHDGLARAIRPAHTTHDGDTVFALATGAGGAVDLEQAAQVAALAEEAVTRAIVNAVLHAPPAGGLPAHGDGAA